LSDYPFPMGPSFHFFAQVCRWMVRFSGTIHLPFFSGPEWRASGFKGPISSPPPSITFCDPSWFASEAVFLFLGSLPFIQLLFLFLRGLHSVLQGSDQPPLRSDVFAKMLPFHPTFPLHCCPAAKKIFPPPHRFFFFSFCARHHCLARGPPFLSSVFHGFSQPFFPTKLGSARPQLASPGGVALSVLPQGPGILFPSGGRRAFFSLVKTNLQGTLTSQFLSLPNNLFLFFFLCLFEAVGSSRQ